MKPLVHARSSARKFGGIPEDYLPIHLSFLHECLLREGGQRGSNSGIRGLGPLGRRPGTLWVCRVPSGPGKQAEIKNS